MNKSYPKMLYRADKLQGCAKVFGSEAFYAVAQDESEADDMLDAGFCLTLSEAEKPKNKKATPKVVKPKTEPSEL
jgi:hypothetical protein